MFIQIHNALRARVMAAPFRQFTINATTGVATAGSTIVVPQGIVVRQLYTAFTEAKTRREVQYEISYQTWEVLADLPGLIDFSEAEDFLSSPSRVELPDRRSVLVALQSGRYVTPPDQSASSGSTAQFAFQVSAFLLRK